MVQLGLVRADVGRLADVPGDPLAHGTIEFQYGTLTGGSYTSATVGIEGDTGSTVAPGNGLQVAFNAAYLTSNLAVRFTAPPPPVIWASVAPASLMLGSGDSGAFTVSFDPTGLPEGTYTGDLLLSSNDPDAAMTVLPLTLTVGGAVTVAGIKGWRMVSAPAVGVTVDDLAAMNLVQGVPGYYPPPQAQPNLLTGYDGTSFASSSGTGEVLQQGHGAFWYFYDIDLTPGGPSDSRALPTPLVTTKAAETGSVVVTLHADGDGSNLLGNPFGTSANISEAEVDSWPGAGALANNILQMWDANLGSYVTNVTKTTVSPWQGFWAEAANAGTLTIPATARAAGGTFLREVPIPTLALELATADGSRRDVAAVVRFADGALDGSDAWDAIKREPVAAASVRLAPVAADGTLRAVETRPTPTGVSVVPLAVEARGTDAALVLTWPGLHAIPDSWTAELRDTYTGTTVNLRTQARYAFTQEPLAAREALALTESKAVAARGAGAARFELHVGPGRATAGESGTRGELSLSAPFPNPSRERTRVAFSLAAPGPARLSLVDALGREVALLADGDLSSGEHVRTLDGSRLAAGIYVIRLVAGGRVLTQRATITR